MVRSIIKEGGWFTPDESGTDTRGCAKVLTEDRSTPSGEPVGGAA